jgi:hypothetical protein
MGKGMPSGYVSCIEVDPTDASKAIVVFSNYRIQSIFYTEDSGNSWTDVSGNLEEQSSGEGSGPSCRWAQILYVAAQPVYLAGTSVGLYSTSELNGTSTVWSQEGAETIGNVVVDMIDVRQADGLVAVGTHGKGAFSTFVETGVEPEKTVLPETAALLPNYPNPFNPQTSIPYVMPSRGHVTIKVFDMRGREVEVLVDGTKDAGEHRVVFRAENLASGIYVVQMRAGSFEQSRRITLMK